MTDTTMHEDGLGFFRALVFALPLSLLIWVALWR